MVCSCIVCIVRYEKTIVCINNFTCSCVLVISKCYIVTILVICFLQRRQKMLRDTASIHPRESLTTLIKTIKTGTQHTHHPAVDARFNIAVLFKDVLCQYIQSLTDFQTLIKVIDQIKQTAIIDIVKHTNSEDFMRSIRVLETFDRITSIDTLDTTQKLIPRPALDWPGAHAQSDVCYVFRLTKDPSRVTKMIYEDVKKSTSLSEDALQLQVQRQLDEERAGCDVFFKFEKTDGKTTKRCKCQLSKCFVVQEESWVLVHNMFHLIHVGQNIAQRKKKNELDSSQVDDIVLDTMYRAMYVENRLLDVIDQSKL